MRNLILFTANFPYGLSETFLETELIYLCRSFEKVTIVSLDQSNDPIRKVPENCIVERFNLSYSKKDALKSLRYYFHPTVKEEISIITKDYQKQLNTGIIKTMLVSFSRGQKTAKYILSKFSENLSDTIFYSYWCDDTALGIALAHKENKQVIGISRMHRWDIYFEESVVNYLPFRHLVANNLHKIVSISQDGIDYATQKWKVNPDVFILCRLGINNTVGQLIPEEDTLKIVSCSNVIPVKRVLLVAETLKQITDKQIKWIHFGDGILMNKLKEQIKQLPKNISVELKGRVPNKEIFSSYQKIKPHLFINVSSSEGIPVSIMEAMSFGIPCIATNVGGNEEIVNNKNGVLLPANPKVEEIQKAICKVYENHRQKSNAAYSTWEKKYNATENYERFCKYLKQLNKVPNDCVVLEN